ncbi:MAG TPA: V-type ATP synthase subunit A [Candidatus Hydrogenedentes bacterium]|jgi:V/A-type H+-transporting ATPase subunit A|nr:MAG: V-type sodium ATPase catalytic subunit A [Candidatus Hydrogenedentes bacterium ADurb.Bin170]HOD95558.1 V-type ATP synthase subunit A [Candidatus Hydrogenedentota bacterium]HOH41710.1 V-type ATP synthase subunit A [Candidatus Hydrogenedentota bacterium]HOM47401.1 V-type ATP synthase subunit A [Candidatus Hydrogenedentota bacterium]HPK24920.1 V-type ATP synthase subunit A [Candidatus Hydrogenedentota bacterium]
MSNVQGVVVKVSGPLVVARGLENARMYEMVRVGEGRLFGEIIEIRSGDCSIQVYEETEGIGPGQPVFRTEEALSVELGPGLIRSIYDGVQRPLDKLHASFGEYIVRGAESPALDRSVQWDFVPVAKVGDTVSHGDILGEVDESKLVSHKIMVPYGVEGKVSRIAPVTGNVDTVVAVIDTSKGPVDISMVQRWPVRKPRPVAKKMPPVQPMTTGQRVLDMFFPLTQGGTACVPGPFGSGKTVVQHQLAKWANAQIVVYVGCGERGNEMTDVLQEFPALIDPKTGEPLMERTVLIANTSNMPVAAREASVFTGITIAEYFRDMGYSVALMADSTSRWAEAMREMSGRLEEMPGEEGYPAYLSSRIASFYERAGNVICKGSDERNGTLSIIGAVSPPGGDFSEPVVQATLRVVKVFWGLDDKLAFARHFPAINWLTSYSLYQEVVDALANEKLQQPWKENRSQAMSILQREAELDELVRLVGMDALPQSDRLLLQAAKMIREDFLHQNAFDDRDTYTSMEKQFKMLDLILTYFNEARPALEAGALLNSLLSLKVLEDIARAKLIEENALHQFDAIKDKLTREIAALPR